MAYFDHKTGSLEDAILGLKEEKGDKEKYTKFFNDTLKKFGVKSPAELDTATVSYTHLTLPTKG